MVTAKQRANRARFAAMARARRGTLNAPGFSFPRSTGRGFRQRAHDAISAFKHGSWGERILGFGVGYFLPQTLDKIGVGVIAYNSIPQYKTLVDAMYTYTNGSTQYSPWSNGGTVAMGKLIGGGLLAKDAWDYRTTGKLSRGKANFGIPFELGMLLDGPELNPMASYGAAPGGGMVGAGGVSW